jgi:uncharacterized protein (DUF433 family)
MSWQDYISIIPGVRSGKPCVKGTRITVSDVLEYLAGGMDERAIMADFPELRREHIQAVLPNSSHVDLIDLPARPIWRSGPMRALHQHHCMSYRAHR